MGAEDDPFDWVEAGPPYERSTTAAADRVAGRSEPERPPAIPDRYAALELEAEAVIVYDCQETNAWIQSTDAVSLAPAEGSTDAADTEWSRAQERRRAGD